MINIFLDDNRTGPIHAPDLNSDAKDWVICRGVETVKMFLSQGIVNNMSLDNDLCLDQETGYELICWMEENNIWPQGKISVHSSNPVGRKNMITVLEKYGKYQDWVLP